MRTPVSSGRAILVPLAIVGFVISVPLALHAAVSAAAPPEEALAVATPPPTPAAFPIPHQVPVTGIPAITASGPLTREVVTQFATAHPVPPHFKAAGTPTVARVALMTSKDVRALLGGESTGLSDASRVYFVELHGTFSFLSPSGRVVSYPVAYEVFDATTGNLVLEGALAASPTP